MENSENITMENFKKQLDYWKDSYDKSKHGDYDEWRKENDLDCKLTDGNLKADTLISLWLPLRYMLNSENTKTWQEYRNKEYNLKSDETFLEYLKDNYEEFIPTKEKQEKIEKLFELGRTRANVIILPDRRWNTLRGSQPYYDYMPHFLYDLLNTEKEEFLNCIKNWIKEEHLCMFFEGEHLDKKNIKDLWGSESPTIHNPKNVDAVKLVENYIEILNARSEYFKNK